MPVDPIVGTLISTIGGMLGQQSPPSFDQTGPTYQRPVTDPHDALYNAMRVISSMGSQLSGNAMKPTDLHNSVIPTPAPRVVHTPSGDMTLAPQLSSDPFAAIQALFKGNDAAGKTPTAEPSHSLRNGQDIGLTSDAYNMGHNGTANIGGNTYTQNPAYAAWLKQNQGR